MIGGRDAAVIVHVELFKTVKISFNLYFPRGENGSWIQNGRFCLFCQWNIQKYLWQGAEASQGSAGAAGGMVGLHPAHPSALGFSLGRSWIPACPTCPKGCLLLEQLFPAWELQAWGGSKKHSQVFHSDGLSSILTPKAVWTKTGLLPGEHLEGLEMESTSSTWTWGGTKAAFLKHKSTFHIGEWTVTGIGEFMARWQRQTVQVLFSRAAHEL